MRSSGSRKLLTFVLALLGALALLAPAASAAPSAQTTVELNVFAAASLNDAFKEIARTFERANPGVKVVYNFAGSQQLAAQIGQGAPADVFASANATQMNAAVNSGRIATGSAKVFVKNRLVVITTAGGIARITRLQDLARPGLKIVLAAKAVPVGQYSLEFLDKAAQDPAFTSDYKDKVLANVVSYEDNVRSVLSKVSLGEGDAGIVYVSDVVSSPKTPVRRINIPTNLNVIASYPIAPLSDSKNLPLAQRYVAYMFSGESRLILAKYGFTLP
jgi:molybdate transport system substrate-binding protein